MKTSFRKKIAVGTIVAMIALSSVSSATACSRALYHSEALNSTQVVRTVDWEGFDKGEVFGVPRNTVLNTGAVIEGKPVSRFHNTTEYKTKYAMLQVVTFDILPLEIMNEKGVIGQMLYLEDEWKSEEIRDPRKIDVDGLNLLQAVVSQAAGLDEVEQLLNGINVNDHDLFNMPGIMSYEDRKTKYPVHFMFADTTGETLLLEIVNGEKRIYRDDKDLRALANDPNYEQQKYIAEVRKGNGVLPSSSITAHERRSRALNAIEELEHYEAEYGIKDVYTLTNFMKGVAAEIFSGYAKWDGQFAANFPTLWTNYANLQEGTFTIDRWDTWEIEHYSFDDFDLDGDKIVKLGENPRAKAGDKAPCGPSTPESCEG